MCRCACVHYIKGEGVANASKTEMLTCRLVCGPRDTHSRVTIYYCMKWLLLAPPAQQRSRRLGRLHTCRAMNRVAQLLCGHLRASTPGELRRLATPPSSGHMIVGHADMPVPHPNWGANTRGTLARPAGPKAYEKTTVRTMQSSE